jgi:hypothetical protein
LQPTRSLKFFQLTCTRLQGTIWQRHKKVE